MLIVFKVSKANKSCRVLIQVSYGLMKTNSLRILLLGCLRVKV